VWSRVRNKEKFALQPKFVSGNDVWIRVRNKEKFALQPKFVSGNECVEPSEK